MDRAAGSPGPDDRRATPEPDRRELSARALFTGLLTGAVLAVGNLYMGLKTGLWDSGSVTASVMGFAILAGCARFGARASPLETNVVQSTATAAGAGPAACGLLGAIPALALAGRSTPGWLAAAWGLTLGVLGVLLALALRRRLLEEERLPFPSGLAAAKVIRAAHGGERSGARPLLFAGLLAGAATLARDVAGWLPGFVAWPGVLSSAPASAYGLGLAASPALWGAGLVIGPSAGAGLLLGSAVAWAGVAPALVRSGAVAAASYEALAPWLAWPGVGLLLGSAAVSLGAQLRLLGGAARDLRALASGGRGPALLVAIAAAGALALGVGGFGLTPLQALLALALAAPLAAVCGRAAGQTDLSPVAEVGQVALAATAWTAGASGAAAVGAGSVTSGAACQTGVSLWSLRSGRELGASPRAQGIAMLLGSAAGAAMAVPVYWLLTRAHAVGSEALPAPGAVPWRALGAALGSGASALPAGTVRAAALAFAAGAALELLGRSRAGRWLPSAGALGMGFLAPAHLSAAIAAGALAGAAWRRWSPAACDRLAPLVAAGAIAGESLTGVGAAALGTLGILPPP